MVRNGSTMERIREDLIRRARMERHGDLEQGYPRESEARQPSQMEMGEQHQDRPGRFQALDHAAFRGFFGWGRGASLGQGTGQAEEVESPKSPAFNGQTGASSLSRSTLPNLSRTWSAGLPERDSGTSAANSVPGLRPPSPDAGAWDMPQPPEPVTHARSTLRAPSSQYSNVEIPGRTETHSSFQARGDGRRSRRRHHGERRSGRRKRRGGSPKRFLFCFPWVKSRRMRAYILRCFVSGLILVALLTVYLALAVSNKIGMGEFTIVLILFVILATVFFCYGLIKLCLIVVRKDRARQNQANRNGPRDGYVIPDQPIRVVLARDEEAAGVESEASKVTPPAYGIWRESVRVDPDRIFWQRNESASVDAQRPETRASRRPPSYASDDGVSYVVEAVSRSVAPSSTSLPTHPSEIGRMDEAVPGVAPREQDVL